MYRFQAAAFIVAAAFLVVSCGPKVVQQPPPPGTRSIGVTPTNYAAKTVGREWFNERVKETGLTPTVKP